ncbi:MAG: glycosyltransferase 87 family protein [Saprospiraceae bacterium]
MIRSPFFIVYCISILVLSFFVHQHDFAGIFTFYSLSFGGYFIYGFNVKQGQTIKTKWSLIIKSILIFAFPHASDDIFRFFWDGMATANGISPYRFTPHELVQNQLISTDPSIFNLLNSKEYYSVYPPVLQFFFLICYWVSFKSIFLFSIFWKLILLVADYVSLEYLTKWIGKKNKLIYWYAFNPLILFEVFANGHPEGLLLSVLVITFYWFQKDKKILYATGLALSASIKLFPIALFPFLFKNRIVKDFLMYGFLTGLVFLITLLPIYPYHLQFFKSIRLYFSIFEFNGSVFEIWKWIDFQRFGFDNVRHISSYLSLIVVIIGTIIFFKQKGAPVKNVLDSMFWFWFMYLICNTTVHPWYVLPILLLGLLNNKVFALVWSYSIIFSYSWYDEYWSNYKYWIIMLEYSLVLTFFLLEKKPFFIKYKNLLGLEASA